MKNFSFSKNISSLSSSITHGTRALISEINKDLKSEDKIIDLSIGSLDMPTDIRIDDGVCQFIKRESKIIHDFAPVKGFEFLRKSIAERVYRLHKVSFDPYSEIIVTPGGIKGAITVIFHTFLNEGDEVIVPAPNWPHYSDMIKLHGALTHFIIPNDFTKEGLDPLTLKKAITDKTKIIILGDCINPTGKVYSSEELESLAIVVANHNILRLKENKSLIYIVFDCPYEAHIIGERAKTFSAIKVKLSNEETCSMKDYTITVTGPGKTYGMHGDRIGYACAPKSIIDVMEKVQVNLNSFASTYGQIATHIAMQEYMDEVAIGRAQSARKNLEKMIKMLSFLNVNNPDGGYFIFVDLSKYAPFYESLGYTDASSFLLHKAKVATISGYHFAESIDQLRHFVRINCGRSLDLLTKAADRIEKIILKC